MKTAYTDLSNNRLAPDANPVEKVPLMVTGDDAEVFIDLLLSSEGENGAGLEGADAATATRRSNRE